MCALNEATSRDGAFSAVIKMEVGPPQVLYRQDLQTAPRCFPGDWTVLNGKGKRLAKTSQVRIEKMNANEPLMRLRKNENSVKTTESCASEDKYSGRPVYWLYGWRSKEGMSSIQAWLRNRGDLVTMQRERYKQRTCEAENQCVTRSQTIS